MPYAFRVAADEADIVAARRKVVQIARSWAVPLNDETFGDLALLCSEVMTNAIRHTHSPCAVVVRWVGARVRVEVSDVDPVRPVPRENSLNAESGRGLLLVESLANCWGSTTTPGGKVVWFEVGPADTVHRQRSRVPRKVRLNRAAFTGAKR